jgi:hypothetical protein
MTRALVVADLTYSAYINPSSPALCPIAEKIQDAPIIELFKICCDRRGIWNTVVASFWQSTGSLFGDCFRQSVVLCSLLRSLGRSSYVAVLSHRGESLGDATHAAVLVSEGNRWALLDVTKTSVKEGIWQLQDSRDLDSNNGLLCIFNDQHAYLVEGDGSVPGLDALSMHQ